MIQSNTIQYTNKWNSTLIRAEKINIPQTRIPSKRGILPRGPDILFPRNSKQLRNLVPFPTSTQEPRGMSTMLHLKPVSSPLFHTSQRRRRIERLPLRASCFSASYVEGCVSPSHIFSLVRVTHACTRQVKHHRDILPFFYNSLSIAEITLKSWSFILYLLSTIELIYFKITFMRIVDYYNYYWCNACLNKISLKKKIRYIFHVEN